MPAIAKILEIRRQQLGERGCPRAILTDNVLRDTTALLNLLGHMFPAIQASPQNRAVIVQDVVHRR
jgi:hypothetical protein